MSSDELADERGVSVTVQADMSKCVCDVLCESVSVCVRGWMRHAGMFFHCHLNIIICCAL